MGLISRFRNLFRAKTSAILDRLEDPEEQLDYMYEQLMSERKRVDRAVRDATADRNLIRHELEEQRRGLQKAHDGAKRYRAKALQLEEQGADPAKVQQYNDAARRLLEDFLKRQARIQELEGRLEKADLRLNAIKEKRIDLQAKLEDLRAKKEQLKSEWRMAKAEERITGALAGLEGDFSDMDLTMARIEEKVRRKKAVAEASAEMIAERRLEEGAPDLPLPEADTDAALAALDRELKGEAPQMLTGSQQAYFFIGVSGGGTWAFPEDQRQEILDDLNKLDNQLSQLSEAGQLTREKFEQLYPQIFRAIRARGKLVGRDVELSEVSDKFPEPEIKLPPEDLEYEEALKLFKGQDLIPG